MATDTSSTATEATDKMLEAIKVGHEATLSVMSDLTEAYASKLPDYWSTMPNFETLIDFSQELWERQREFNKNMYEAIAPIGRSAFGAAKDTAKAAKSATDHAKPAAEHTRASAAKA